MERDVGRQVDRTKLRPGLYVSRTDWFPKSASNYARARFNPGAPTEIFPVTTFDLRIIPPNDERFKPLEPATMHTITHLGSTFLRLDSIWKNRLIYFGPKGCRTGFDLVMFGELSPNMVISPGTHYQTVRELLIGMCWYIMQFESDNTIPGASPEECGNYLDHNILSARAAANDYYYVLTKTQEQLGYNPFEYPE